jgi:hypothetical protein
MPETCTLAVLPAMKLIADLALGQAASKGSDARRQWWSYVDLCPRTSV